jgi:hypothetical protein
MLVSGRKFGKKEKTKRTKKMIIKNGVAYRTGKFEGEVAGWVLGIDRAAQLNAWLKRTGSSVRVAQTDWSKQHKSAWRNAKEERRMNGGAADGAALVRKGVYYAYEL